MAAKLEPWIERLKPLHQRLLDIGAFCAWRIRGTDDRDCMLHKKIIVEFWIAPSNKTYMVRIWADGSGWEVYTPLDDTLDIDATLEKIK